MHDLAHTQNQTVNPAIRRAAARQLFWIRVSLVIGVASVAALAARVEIKLPFTPVPVTLQTLAVLLSAVALGGRYGSLSMAFYVVLGTAGYHVFAGGAGGLTTLFGPTGGYLLGFVLAQPVVGGLTACPRGRPGPRRSRILAAAVCGEAVVFTCGLVWLYVWSGHSLAHTLALGLWPFVPGEAVKVLAVAGVGRPLTERTRRWFERG